MMRALGVYEIFWGAAGLIFALGGAAALAGSERREGRRAAWVLLCTPLLAAVLALAGARAHAMSTSPAALWTAIWEGRFWEAALGTRQRISGGLLLAAGFLVFVAPRLGGRRAGDLRILATVLPIAGLSIAVGRLGCFLAGCCFGLPTTMPWAVVYPRGSAAYWNHVAQGGIPDGARESLAVHPLSLYLGAAALLCSGVVLGARRAGVPAAARVLVFLLCMALTRLLLEPLREVRFLGAVPGQRTLDLVLVCASVAALAALSGRAFLRRPQAPPLDVFSSSGPNGRDPSRPGMPRR